MKEIAAQFKNRAEPYKDQAIRPITPNTDELKRLDDEVEEKRRTKVLKMDNFSESAAEKSGSFLDFKFPEGSNKKMPLSSRLVYVYSKAYSHFSFSSPRKIGCLIHGNSNLDVSLQCLDYSSKVHVDD